MHTNKTLRLLDDITKSLRDAIRAFEADTCPAFYTKELKREAQCRQCHEARAQHQHMHSTAPTPAHKPKTFNLCTYKLHALADYTVLRESTDLRRGQ